MLLGLGVTFKRCRSILNNGSEVVAATNDIQIQRSAAASEAYMWVGDQGLENQARWEESRLS